MLQIHVYIEVPTIDVGLRFYCEGVGLSLKKQLSPRWVELSGAATPIFLIGGRPDVVDFGGKQALRDFERHWTPVHLDFVVDDLDETLTRLLAHGATLDRPVKEREYGRIANMADPFGNGFDVIQFSGEGYSVVNRMS